MPQDTETNGELELILKSLYQDTLGLTFRAEDLVHLYSPSSSKSVVHRFLLIKKGHEDGRLVPFRVNQALSFLVGEGTDGIYILKNLTPLGSVNTLWQVKLYPPLLSPS